MSIVNAKLLMQAADAIDIGCDVLHFGDRKIEKLLGAENASGDTVYMTEADGGAEFTGMDASSAISGGCGVSRSQIPLQVATKGCVYSLTQDQIDLMIKDSEFADKIMARFVDGRNAEAYDCICGGAQAVAVNKSSGAVKTDDLVAAFFDSLAAIEAIKLKGKIYGIGNSLTLNAMAKGLAQGTAGIGVQSHGGELWQRNLSNFGGLDWSKSGVLGTVTATALPSVCTAYAAAKTDEAGFKYIDEVTLTVTSGTWEQGARITPFTIAGFNVCDVLGNDTGIPMTFEGTVKTAVTSGTSITVVLDNPIHWQSLDPVRNCYTSLTINTSGASGLTQTAASVLSSGKTYYKPVVMFNENEFKVAVKGLSPMKASDSATIPTGFSEKGILPIRGTAWTDQKTSTLYVRFDAMFGFKMKRGLAARKVYIEV